MNVLDLLRLDYEPESLQPQGKELAEVLELLKEVALIEVGMKALQILLEGFEGMHSSQRLACL